MSSAALRFQSFEERYAEVEALPQGVTGEIVGPGDLRVRSRPGFSHGLSARRLTRALSGFDLLMGGSGWCIDLEREIRFPDDRLLVPDLAGWRVQTLPDFIRDNPIQVVPDWVCEVLSPSTAAVDRAIKLPVYARSGVAHIWMIDPAARSLEVYAAREGYATLVQTAVDAAELQPPPFDLPIRLADLWEIPLASRG